MWQIPSADPFPRGRMLDFFLSPGHLVTYLCCHDQCPLQAILMLTSCVGVTSGPGQGTCAYHHPWESNSLPGLPIFVLLLWQTVQSTAFCLLTAPPRPHTKKGIRHHFWILIKSREYRSSSPESIGQVLSMQWGPKESPSLTSSERETHLDHSTNHRTAFLTFPFQPFKILRWMMY